MTVGIVPAVLPGIVTVKAIGTHLLYELTMVQGSIIWSVLDRCVSSLIPRWPENKAKVSVDLKYGR